MSMPISKNRIVLFLITIALIVILAYQFIYMFFGNDSKGINIFIKNETLAEISGLKIVFDNNIKDIQIPNIPTRKTYKLNINPVEEFSENSACVEYRDRLGKSHKEIAIGYFEKGYNVSTTITIMSIDSEGKMNFKIKRNF